MKKNLVLTFGLSMFLLLSACNSNKTGGSAEPTAKDAVSSNEDKELTGTFEADGKQLSGKVSTQLFPSTKEFSVLCQDDADINNSRLIQFVFKDEASARAGGSFKIVYDNIMAPEESKEVSLTLDNTYRSQEGTKGSVTISKDGDENIITFEDITLTNTEKKTATVKGKIPF